MDERTCTIEGCDKPLNARGWCKGHYRRWNLYGDPLGTPLPRPKPAPKPKRPCEADGCDRPHYGNGLCEAHWARQRRHGGLDNKRGRPYAESVANFWARVVKSDSCWLWQGPPNSSGYGRVNFRGRILGAHVVAVIVTGREIPDGMEVDHLCFTPLCVRPDHLDVVTPIENQRRKRPRRAA